MSDRSHLGEWLSIEPGRAMSVHIPHHIEHVTLRITQAINITVHVGDVWGCVRFEDMPCRIEVAGVIVDFEIGEVSGG